MPATTVGNFILDEYLRDPSFYGKQLWNPATEDPYTDPVVRQRIYNQLKASGQLQPSFDAMTGPESSWTAAGTDYNSALNIPDAPDRDQSFLSEMAPIIAPFAGAIGGAGWLSSLLGGGAGAAGFGGLLDTALPAEMFSGGGFGGLLDTALPAEMFGGGMLDTALPAGMFGGNSTGNLFNDPLMGMWDESFGGLSGDGLANLYKEFGISPTMSLPGVGDIYGSGSSILKNIGNLLPNGAGTAGSLLAKLFIGSGGANSGSYSFPFADVLKGLLEYSGQKDYQSELLRLMDKSIEYSDPFRTQRPRYFEPLYDAATKGIGGTPYGDSIANSTLRKLSSTGDAGYDISGLGANTLAKNLNSASMDYVKNLAPLAGAQFGGNASQSITSMGPAAAGAGLAAQGGLGAAFEAANRGNQPSALEQLFGQQKNQNLGQALFSF